MKQPFSLLRNKYFRVFYHSTVTFMKWLKNTLGVESTKAFRVRELSAFKEVFKVFEMSW